MVLLLGNPDLWYFVVCLFFAHTHTHTHKDARKKKLEFSRKCIFDGHTAKLL